MLFNMYLKEKLFYETEKIQDSKIIEFTQKALNNVPNEFWTAPCSSSGKNHPPEDQGEGGIVRHILKGTYICQDLCRFFKIQENDVDEDIVMSGWILHDAKKNGDPWGERTDYTHGLIAYNWLEQFELEEPKKEKIRNCVRYHMWKWVQPEEEIKRATNPSTNERIVQLTDYFCSRKKASFLPGINLNERDIEKYSKNLD